MQRKFNFAVLSGFMLFTTAVQLWAYPSVAGCPSLNDGDFDLTVLASNNPGTGRFFQMMEPIQMAFDQDNTGVVNVFFTELEGNVNRIDGATGLTERVADLPVGHIKEDGLTGITLDPAFSTNGWIYLYYNKYEVGGQACVYRLGRYTFRNGQIDPASEAVLLEIPCTVEAWHTGGSMAFDSKGDLFVGIGDSMADELGPSCLSDLKGSVIRIRPLPVSEGTTEWGIGKTYSIPAGNFAEFFSGDFTEYSDPAKVRPELFATGARNPYTITVHPTKSWVTWGDCGPDHGWVTEEHNVAPEPGYYGYPFFAGNNMLRPGKNNSASAPTNTNPGCPGADDLPPAIPATHAYQQACAMTGPIYAFNRENPNSNKLPPQFHNKWIITDFNDSWIRWVGLTDNGKSLIGTPENMLGGLTIYKPLDMDVGPDGALYVSNYAGYNSASLNTSIVKIEYTGNPDYSAECLTNALGADVAVGPVRRTAGKDFLLTTSGLNITPDGEVRWRVSTVGGVLLHEDRLKGAAAYTWDRLLPAGLENGVYLFEMQGGENRLSEVRPVFR